MLNYLKKNVNPKGRKTGDCSTRALVSALGIDYEQALMLQVKMALKTGYDITSHQVMERVLKEFGYIKMAQPRKIDNTKYLVCEMDKVIPAKQRKKGVIVNVARHYVPIKDNDYIDIWNSGFKCVGNYYIRID